LLVTRNSQLRSSPPPLRPPLPFRRDEPMPLGDDGGDGAPSEVGVEVDADPAAGAYVGWAEEVLRVRIDERFLRAGRLRHPRGEAAVAVTVVGERDVLAAGKKKAWRAV